MQNPTLEEIRIEVVLESHLDMFFYQLLAVVIQEHQDKTFDLDYNDTNRDKVSDKFLNIARVILYDAFQVKLENYDISEDERQYVMKEYKGYYNYAEVLVLDTIHRINTVHKVNKNFGCDEYEFMQLCGGIAFNRILDRIQNEIGNEYFKHSFVSRFEDTKLVIYTSVFGLFNAKILFAAYRENKFSDLLSTYLTKCNLFLVNRQETSIEFDSDLVIGLNDAQLRRTLPYDFFKSYKVDFKINKGVFWRYLKRNKEDYFSFGLAPKLTPVVSFLDDPLKTLLRQCQIYLEYIKV